MSSATVYHTPTGASEGEKNKKEKYLEVDTSKVIFEGTLRKKGNHLYSYRFKKKYFYLEDH